MVLNLRARWRQFQLNNGEIRRGKLGGGEDQRLTMSRLVGSLGQGRASKGVAAEEAAALCLCTSFGGM